MTQTKHQKTEVVSGHEGWYRNGDMGAGILFETDPLPEDSDPDLLHRPPSPRDHAANVWINPKLSTFPRFLTGSYEMERTTNPEQVVGGKRWSAKAHYGNTSAASGSGGLSKFPEPAGSCATHHNTEIEEPFSGRFRVPVSACVLLLLPKQHSQNHHKGLAWPELLCHVTPMALGDEKGLKAS